jgi:NAD(P)-dependent dehydrogenase (short-subunit alcohol dehydrogenase family)
MALHQFPAHYGFFFTKTSHSKAEGPTDPQNIQLKNPFVVAVTGAGKGIGYRVALQFARAGASGIAISSRTQKDLDALSAELFSINSNLKVLSFLCDITNEAQVANFASAVKDKFGRLDAIIANAGLISDYVTDPDGSNRRMASTFEDDVDFFRTINTNLIGTVWTAKYFVPLLATTKDGPQAFVGITSPASQFPTSALTPMSFNLSKYAMNRLCESISVDYHEKSGVCCYALGPGNVTTPGSENHPGEIWKQSKTFIIFT